jgi:ABC-type thiamine transport system substrate-binding protein
MKDKGQYVEIPGDEYPPIEQGCVILKSSKQKDTAKAFLSFIKTPAVAELFRTNGFAVPSGSTQNWKIQIEIISEEPLMKTFLLLVVAASLTLSKNAVAAKQEQIQALSAHLIAHTFTQSKTEGQGCDIRGRASGMLRARGTRPDSGSALHSVGLPL